MILRKITQGCITLLLAEDGKATREVMIMLICLSGVSSLVVVVRRAASRFASQPFMNFYWGVAHTKITVPTYVA